MPLGNVLGAFAAKVSSLRISDLDGSQKRLEFDPTDETKGRVPGQIRSRMAIDGVIDCPVPCAITGTLLAASGAVVHFAGRGVGMLRGEGHEARYRGAACCSTDDSSLTAFNSVLGGVEFEIDPATMAIQGAVCE